MARRARSPGSGDAEPDPARRRVQPAGAAAAPKWLTGEQALRIAAAHGTPIYAYSLRRLREAAQLALAFPCLEDRGVTVRYAMKANPTRAVLQLFLSMGLHFDCSSVHEVRRAIAAGVPAARVSLSSQELSDFAALVGDGLAVNCCSLLQLKRFCAACPGKDVGIRFNPGIGSGSCRQCDVGGPLSSFGIWHELWPECAAVAKQFGCKIVRIHTHIGSGSDPAVWRRAAESSLKLCEHFPDVHTLNLGGGFKVARFEGERSTDLQRDCATVRSALEDFAARTGRRLALEIEPGTFLVARAGSLITRVGDVVSTGGPEGKRFVKLDAGMTEILRPCLYGSQHEVAVVPQDPQRSGSTADYVVVGHCCESGDLITPAPGAPGVVAERTLCVTEPGDVAVVEDAGAYCASMCAKNYNSFPEVGEVLVGDDGAVHCIRRPQALQDLWSRELALPDGLGPR
eukprot:TRINITY_DN9554_c0_g1_i1.p1 TRINITY_DN9554_c0_g1~~TRINITY_DN9554_c0_g1_i1.p1  ORF type:complete len:456 (+),score=83.31 TRINITY_DN9554_c0_g1_i1:93-1460(+)